MRLGLGDAVIVVKSSAGNYYYKICNNNNNDNDDDNDNDSVIDNDDDNDNDSITVTISDRYTCTHACNSFTYWAPGKTTVALYSSQCRRPLPRLLPRTRR